MAFFLGTAMLIAGVLLMVFALTTIGAAPADGPSPVFDAAALSAGEFEVVHPEGNTAKQPDRPPTEISVASPELPVSLR